MEFKMCMFQLRFYYNRMAFKLTTLSISCKTYTRENKKQQNQWAWLANMCSPFYLCRNLLPVCMYVCVCELWTELNWAGVFLFWWREASDRLILFFPRTMVCAQALNYVCMSLCENCNEIAVKLTSYHNFTCMHTSQSQCYDN